MRISESFAKMRLSDYCSSQDMDRAIAVTVDSFVGSQKVSCKRALARAFAKYVARCPSVSDGGGARADPLCRYTLAKPSAQRGGRRNARGGRTAAVEA